MTFKKSLTPDIMMRWRTKDSKQWRRCRRCRATELLPILQFAIFNLVLCVNHGVLEMQRISSLLFLSKRDKPDCKMYNMMIKALSKKGMMSKATELLRKMEVGGCFPGSGSYNAVIRGFILNDDLQNALKYCDDMVTKGFEAGVETGFVCGPPF
ncbi:hypothetical protein Cgig2_019138 [Carnegiea gigantea]|uniref:Pentatricopeptide repeat-containing protein n=1 Tax=Carnegiea gigantea TaxID=171969 RepID=A0A9Q1JTA3_9CARY|nr:hypothetical protein Cgig2_019138 [Carnegiea gigantea]